MTEEKKPELEFEVEINPQLTEEELSELFKIPVLATLWQGSNAKITYLNKSELFDAAYLSKYCIWLAGDLIIHKRFLVREYKGRHLLSTSVTKEKFTELPKSKQTEFKQKAAEEFKYSTEEKQQALINEALDNLTKMKDDLPENIQKALEEKIKQKDQKSKEDDLLIAKVAAQMEISVEQLQRTATLLYCVLAQGQATEEKESALLACPKEQTEIAAGLSKKSKQKNQASVPKEKDVRLEAVEEMIDHNQRAKPLERVHINKNSIWLWLREHHGVAVDPSQLSRVLKDKAHEIIDHNQKYQMNGMHNSKSNYYQNHLKKWSGKK